MQRGEVWVHVSPWHVLAYLPMMTSCSQPRNKLAGTIPDAFLDELINISFVDLAFNDLSGTVPTQAGQPSTTRA